MKKLTYFILLTVSILFYFSCYGQVNTAIQWQKAIGGNIHDKLYSIQQTTDGGYIIGGVSSSNISGDKTENSKGGSIGDDYWILKLNSFGIIEWQKTIGGNGDDYLSKIQQTADGGYIVGGYSNSNISGDKSENNENGFYDYWIIKLNSVGDIIWQNTIGGNNDDVLIDLRQTLDGGYILGGYSNSNISGDKSENKIGGIRNDYWVVKVNGIGNIEWQNTIGGVDDDYLLSIEQVNDSGYILGGHSNSNISVDKSESSRGGTDYWVVKLNSRGNVVWNKTIGGSNSDALKSIHQTIDGGYILGGDSYSQISGDKTEINTNGFNLPDYWIIKIDSIGNIIWQNTIGGAGYEELYSIKQTLDGGYVIGGASTSVVSGDKTDVGNGNWDYWVVKVDDIGNVKWQKSIGGDNEDKLISIEQCLDKSYILAGYSYSGISGNKTENSKGGYDYWIVKLAIDPRYITGNIFSDNNNNCLQNLDEKAVPHINLKAYNNNQISYATSQTNGKYYIPVNDTGLYNIELLTNPTYPYFSSSNCNSYFIHLRDSIDTINFAMKPDKLCTLNTVNISANAFRRCRQNTFYVSYCNNGTIASTNTYIDVKLDRLLVLNSASVSYSALPNNTYRFNIGTLDYLTCGNFSINATPICDSTITGQTLCTEAHIYPDTICTTPNYTGSYIVASAKCLGDSVELKLENRGGNMQQIKHYIVIEDQVMRINRNYQLPRNGIIIEKMPADSGHTYRIIADQEDNFPPSYGDKFATAAIEGCRPNPALNFSTGYFTQFPNYDGEPFRAMSCNVITGSYDPNDKVASPVGYAAQHYIEKNTQIDYQINFQNTGNDTAFKVVVVDTIAPTLDINSIQLGVASHAYQFQRIDSNVVQFVFDNILLVDSFRNEPKSHGFVKFKIQQKLNNTNGTKIYNSAAIYFDYNAPIITNRTYHTVGQNFVTVQLINTIKNPKYNVKEVKVFPNPFREKTQIIVESNELKNPVLLLMNIQGQLIKTISSTNNNTFDIYREDLSNGMYLFKIIQGNDEVANGKVVVQ